MYLEKEFLWVRFYICHDSQCRIELEVIEREDIHNRKYIIYKGTRWVYKVQKETNSFVNFSEKRGIIGSSCNKKGIKNVTKKRTFKKKNVPHCLF